MVTTIQVVVEVQDPILKLTPLMAPVPVMEEMVLIRSSWARLISLAVVAVAQAIPEVLPATEDKVVAEAVAVPRAAPRAAQAATRPSVLLYSKPMVAPVAGEYGAATDEGSIEKVGRDLLDDLRDDSGLAVKIVTVMFDSDTMWSESRSGSS